MKRKGFIFQGLFVLAGLVLFYFPANASNSASAVLKILVDPYEPAPVLDLSARSGNNLGEVDLRWTATGDDWDKGQLPTGSYIIKFDKKSLQDFSGDTTAWWDNAERIYRDASWLPATPGSTETITIDAFTIQEILNKTTFYFAVKSVDKAGNSSQISNIVSAVPRWDITPPEAITDLVVCLNADRTGVVLEWTAPKDVFFGSYISKVAGYQIKRATVSVGDFLGNTTAWWNSAMEISPPEPAEPGVKQTLELKDLMGGVTYYFAIRSFDEQGNISEIDLHFVTRQGIYIETDAATPNQVSGVWAEIINGKFRIHWSGVDLNRDGTLCDDLVGYNIWRSTNPFLKGFVVATTTTTVYETVYSSQTVYYYSITAFDSAVPFANESTLSMKVDNTEELNLWICSGSAALRIPAIIQNIMRIGRNSYNDNLDINVKRKTAEENYRVVASYEFIPVKNSTGKKADKFIFTKPVAEIRLYYNPVSGTIRKTAFEENYAIMWYNGIEWIKLGGEINEKEGFVSIRTQRLGKYQLRRSLRTKDFTLLNGPIPKIITPNGDGYNDFCEFFYDNPGNYAPTGKIFDITGAFVANMKRGPVDSGSSGSLRWDGLDSSGRIVSSGIYIWQIEVGGKVYNGTIVVAR